MSSTNFRVVNSNVYMITNGHKVILIATKFCVDGFATARETVKYGSSGDISRNESDTIKFHSAQVAK